MAAGMSSQAGASKPGFHQQMTELIMAPAANATAAMTAACMSSVRPAAAPTTSAATTWP